jgi:uncharacterized repeat protein (TIGR01451 family)
MTQPLTHHPRHRRPAALLAAAMLLLVLAHPLAAQTPQRGFRIYVAGFDDVNGNGTLDCGEPVTLGVGYFDSPQDSTAPITGHITALYAGSTGLSFLPGTVAQDFTLTSGSCQGTILGGNAPSDAEADLSFTCGSPSAYPVQGNAIAWTFQALFTGTGPTFTAAANATTSDGLDQQPNVNQSGLVGTVCTSPGPSITFTKTAAGTGAPGSTLVYTLRVTDLSGLGLGGVQVTDVVPPATTFDGAASTAGWSCPATTSGTLCTLPLGNVPPNGTATAHFAVTLASPLPAGTTAVANTACARQGPTQILGCATANTPTTGAPLLHLAKTLLSGTPTPGATLVYQLAASNTGNQDAGPLTLAETVPAATTWSAAGSPGWTCAATSPGSACTLALPNLPAGTTSTTRFAVVLADPLPAGLTATTNTACIAGTQTCGSLTTPTDGTPAVSLHKSLAGTAAPGATLTYTLAVQSTGNQGAPGVVVSEPLPALTTFLPAASSPGWTCAANAPPAPAGTTCTNPLGTLAAGATATLTFAVQVQNPLPAGATTITNTACATFTPPGGPADPACDTLATPTQGQAKLLLAKHYAGGPVTPGALLAFALDLTNAGNQDAGPVTLHETVPALTTFDTAHSTAGWTCTTTAPAGTCTLALPALAAGATAQATFAVIAAAALPAAAVVTNTACAATATGTAACATTATPAALTLAATLTVAPRIVTVTAGIPHPTGTLQYTLTLPNTNPQTLAGLVTTLALDPRETLVTGSVATDLGTVTTGNGPRDTTVAVALGDLAPGQTATVTFACQLPGGLPPGTFKIAAQAFTSGTELPSTPSDDPTTPQVDDPTATQVTVDAAPPQAIPTLGHWGLTLLTTALALAGLAITYRRQRGHRPHLTNRTDRINHHPRPTPPPPAPPAPLTPATRPSLSNSTASSATTSSTTSSTTTASIASSATSATPATPASIASAPPPTAAADSQPAAPPAGPAPTDPLPPTGPFAR